MGLKAFSVLFPPTFYFTICLFTFFVYLFCLFIFAAETSTTGEVNAPVIAREPRITVYTMVTGVA